MKGRYDSVPPLAPGQVLEGAFELRGILGEGGMGVVYDAVELATGREVALKVMHGHLAGDEQVRGRFRREAAILRRLQGDNVCPVLASGEAQDPRRPGVTLLYLALLKVQGSSLESLVAPGPLPPDRAIAVLLDVCAALRVAHGQGVIHRDLKPGNVLLRSGDGRAVVVDFGLAKIVAGSGTGTTQLTQHNMIFGTPEYMAPEQARGEELDERCDIYAAGVVLFQMLTGRVPFGGSTPLAVLTAHMTEAPPRPDALVPGLAPALSAVVLHALAKEPRVRYGSAAALAAALRQATEVPGDVDAVGPPSFRSVTGDELAQARTWPSVPAPEPPSAVGPVPSGPISRAPLSRVSGPVWTAVWIVALTVGIGVGVWLSLR